VKKEIKQNIKRIQPKSLSENILILSPGNDNFQDPNDQRQKDEPIKIIGPRGICDFLNQVIKVASK